MVAISDIRARVIDGGTGTGTVNHDIRKPDFSETLAWIKGDVVERPKRETPAGEDAASESTDAVGESYEVDLKKPLVLQVGHLRERYVEWVHKPIITKESPRFFASNFIEGYLSKTCWWVVPLIWLPVVGWALRRAIEEGVNSIHILPLMVTGAFIWTLIEYSFHRFIFHHATTSYWTNTVHYLLHGCHHKHPMDRLRLVFPPVLSSFIILCIFLVVRALFPLGASMALFGGGLLGYIAYDLTHYYVHHGSPTSEFLRKLKRYHMNHHYKDSNAGFGITTALWDHIFSTHPVSQLGASVKVPAGSNANQ